MGKRLLASFLAAAMMLTMAPFAFAIENTEDTIDDDQIPATEEAVDEENQIETKNTSTLQSNIDAAKAGATVTMSADTTADITISKNLVLDLNGKTLTNTNAGMATITVANGATVTVQHGSVQGGTSYYNIQVAAGGTLTLEGVTATAGNNGSSMIDNCGTLTIESGTYTGGLNVVKSEPNATLTITGGTFNLESAVAKSYTGVVMNYGDAVITGGTFNQNATTPSSAYPIVVITAKENEEEPRPTTKITGGTFVNKHTSNAKIFHAMNKAYQSDFDVSGGTFSKKVAVAYCPNYIVEEDSTTGMYSVGAKAVAVQVRAGSDYVYENYANIAQAVRGASKKYTVKLLQNVTEDINIPASKVVNLDLNGHTLTNASGDTITVAAKGTLTIQGEGTVDNVTHGKAAIVNNGTVTLNGGTYTRSKENPENTPNNNGGNSYYTILNDKGGNMTINSGVTVTNVGHFSSAIRNGGDAQSTAKSVLTINGGTFSGGINTIKNDELGELTINGGDFSNTTQLVVMNWNDATINGGTFSVNKSAEAVLQTAAWTPSGERSVGKMTINGGTFKGTGEQAMIEPTFVYNDTTYSGTASVSGGVFTADVTKFCAPGYKTELTNGVYVVKAGTNEALDKVDTAIADGATEDQIKDAVEAVTNTPNETLSSSSTTMDKLAQLEEKVTNNKITVEAKSEASEVSDLTATNAKLSADPGATTDQKITIDVTASNASVDEAKTFVGAANKMTAKALDITMKLNGDEITPKAPVVLTFDLPTDWANAKIVYMNGSTPELVKTSVSTDANGKATISGTFNHFSTYVLVQTEAALNPNEYEIILTPTDDQGNIVTDVSAGDTINYTVALKHVEGDGENGMFTFVPGATSGLLTGGTFTPDSKLDSNNYTFGKENGKDKLVITELNLTKGATLPIGKLSYKVDAYPQDMTKIEFTNTTSEGTVSNDGRRQEATVTLVNKKDVIYHVVKVIFRPAVGEDTVGYAVYGSKNEMYSTLEALKNRSTDATVTAPTLSVDTTGETNYRVKDEHWHLLGNEDQTYELADGMKTSVIFVENYVKLAKVTIPMKNGKSLVEITDKVTRTDSEGNQYVDQGQDLKFKLTNDATANPGMEYEVKVKVGNETITPNGPTDGIYTVPGSKITGEVSFELTQKMALTAGDIGIFTDTDTTGKETYRDYSTYSGKRTLVLIKGDANAKYQFGTTTGQHPTIYKTDAYEGYNFGVLIDPTNVNADKASMLAYMVNELGLNVVTSTEKINPTIKYDFNTNGLDGAPLADAQVTRDFIRKAADSGWYWEPTDDLLLKADVITAGDGADLYDKDTYKGTADGHVSADDLSTFMYLYVGMPKTN